MLRLIMLWAAPLAWCVCEGKQSFQQLRFALVFIGGPQRPSLTTHLEGFRRRGEPTEVLDDLTAETPGDEGKWFAAAKDAMLFDKALALAQCTPCCPQTLTRAAREFQERNPEFAREAGVAALHWLVQGYEVTGLDIVKTYSHTIAAAENAGRAVETRSRISDLVARESSGECLVNKALGPHLASRDPRSE